MREEWLTYPPVQRMCVFEVPLPIPPKSGGPSSTLKDEGIQLSWRRVKQARRRGDFCAFPTLYEKHANEMQNTTQTSPYNLEVNHSDTTLLGNRLQI
jgi:hypothetical protein